MAKHWCHNFYSAPFQISVALFFLWQTLGPSVMAGFFVMILMIPLNTVATAKSRKLQQNQMKEKDQRVKMMNEILQGIKVVCFDQLTNLKFFLYKNGPFPTSFQFNFVFSNKHYNFYNTKYEKCPFNILCWYLNLQPSEHESPLITTRQGLPPSNLKYLLTKMIPIQALGMGTIRRHL